MEPFTTAAVSALAVGSTAYTISATKITAPLRTWAHERGARSRPWAWASALLSCPYCLAHWLSAGAVAVYRPFLVDAWWPLDFAVTTMAVVAASMVPVWGIKRALHPAAAPAAVTAVPTLQDFRAAARAEGGRRR
jgi:hypothetical protein